MSLLEPWFVFLPDVVKPKYQLIPMVRPNEPDVPSNHTKKKYD